MWYFSPGQAAALDAMKFFALFKQPWAPVSSDQPCEDRWGVVVALCVQNGCYAPTERMLFERKYLPIPEAAARDLSTVTTPADSSFDFSTSRSRERVIAAYISGDTQENLTRITVESGRSIRVTSNHPLIDGSAHIIVASDIRPGVTRLMSVDATELVVGARIESFSGKVWNVLPESEELAANVLVAEDFLNGSVRYQNEWAADQSRLWLRHVLNVSEF